MNTNMENKETSIKKICYTPKQMVNILDKYVIGQDEAKKIISVGIYNHWKRVLLNKFNVGENNNLFQDVNIEKSNIMLIGPTGTGKTYMIKTIAKLIGIPCYIADATRLTAAGYVGDDIETILTGLLQECDYKTELAEMGIVVIDEADKMARKDDSPSLTRDVGGESVQQGILKIVEGSKVGVPPNGGRKHPEQPLIYVDTSNILFIFMGAFDGIDKIIEKRINKSNIGFNKKEIDDKKSVEITTEDLKKYGFISELIGRFPIIATTNKLSINDLYNILANTKNSLIKQYQKLFTIENNKLLFTDESLKMISKLAYDTNTGARGLKRIIEKILNNISYEYSDANNEEIRIDKEYINKVINLKQAA